MFSFYKKMRKRFFEGPDWILPPSYLLNDKYRSPTVLIFTWSYAWLLRVLTVPGRIVLPICFLIISYTLIIFQNPIRLLAFGLAAIVTSDLILGYIFRPKKVRISRTVPKRTRQNHQFELTYKIRNCGRFPLWNILIDSIPFGGRIANAGRAESITSLKQGDEISFSRSIAISDRGAHTLYAPILETVFPFTIFKWSRRGTNSDKITVHPDFSKLQNINLPIGSRYQKEGNANIARIGESSDFIGCRECRTGDNPKHIHWPSSARRTELVVREFQEEYLTRIAVVADTYVPPDGFLDLFRENPRKKRFEAAVRLCASVADYLSGSDYLIDFFAAGPNVYHFRGGRSLLTYDYMLDIISCLEPNRKEPISELSPELLEIVSQIGSAILILLKWAEPRKKLWSQLVENGVSVKTIIISDSAEGIPPDFVHLSSQNILEGALKNL
jgi:uncharacterized protein (DUF58 family)